MTDAELFGLTDDEKRREHIQRSPEIEALRKSFENETIFTVAFMQLRARSLFSEMILGKITGYRVEMDRSVHPATFHIKTWKNVITPVTIDDGLISQPNPDYFCVCGPEDCHPSDSGDRCLTCHKSIR